MLQLTQTSSGRRRNPLSTRGGTLAVAGAIALLAAIILIFFLQQYRAGLTGSDRAQVLVATTLIPRGTSGEMILEDKAYRPVTVRRSELENGTIVDPNLIAHR